MQALVEGERLSVVREFVGHGIGRDMHEEPKVANYHDRKQKKSDFLLQPGLTMAVEPMVVVGRPAVEYARPDRWVVVTKDGGFSAHFEHTVAVTQTGVDILTNGL
jgi:methionyl aminopeptidase